MRDYGKIRTTIWRSKKFAALKDDRARLFYMYLHTCPHANSLGCFVLPVGYATSDLGWSETDVKHCLNTLCAGCLIGVDHDESVVRIVDFLRHDPAQNESHVRGILKIADTIPDCNEKLFALKELAESKYAAKVTDLAERIDTLSTPCPHHTPIPIPIPTPNPNNVEPQSASTASDSKKPNGSLASETRQENAEAETEFDAWYREYPRHEGKGQARKAYKAARKKAGAETLLNGARQARHRYSDTERHLIPMPATWLNGERWLDEADSPAAVAQPPPGANLVAWYAKQNLSGGSG